MVATATSWALLLPAYGVFQRLLSRSFIARGFVEEAFVGQVNSPMIEMGGDSQYGTPFGMAHFECAAAGSGALAIKDGLDTAYVGWNPESDMGNIEIWEQNMPMVYIGRSIVPNSGGAGKYRGGCSFVSTWLVNKTSHLQAAHVGAFIARVRQWRHVRRLSGADLPEASRGARLQHPRACRQGRTAGARAGHRSARLRLEKRFGGEHDIVEGPYITAPHKAGDIFSHSYNGGGGYGDVLERDPVKTAWDVENGFLTREAADQVFGIVLKDDEDGYPVADLDATAKRRADMRKRAAGQGDTGVGLDRRRARARREGRLRAGGAERCMPARSSCRRASPRISAISGTSTPDRSSRRE